MRSNRKLIAAILGIFILVLVVAAIGRNRDRDDSAENSQMASDQSRNVLGSNSSDLDTSTWETSRIPGTQVSFMHPASWNVNTIVENDENFRLRLSSPDTFTIDTLYGPYSQEKECTTAENTDMGRESINVLNQNWYIYYSGNPDQDEITDAYLSEETAPCASTHFVPIPSNVNIGDQTDKGVSVRMFYQNDNNMSSNQFKGQDMQIAKMILSSVKVND